MSINSKVYDILKWIAIVVLPAGNLCVKAILTAVGVDAGIVDMISEIILAVDAFLGALLGVSSASYYKEKDSATTSATTETSEEVEEQVTPEEVEDVGSVEDYGESVTEEDYEVNG